MKQTPFLLTIRVKALKETQSKWKSTTCLILSSSTVTLSRQGVLISLQRHSDTTVLIKTNYQRRIYESSFSTLALLAGHQQEHPACKNWVMRCSHGHLSAARCTLFAYGPADVTTMPSCHFIKIQNCLTFFLVLAYQVVLEKSVKWVPVCLSEIQIITPLEHYI